MQSRLATWPRTAAVVLALAVLAGGARAAGAQPGGKDSPQPLPATLAQIWAVARGAGQPGQVKAGGS